MSPHLSRGPSRLRPALSCACLLACASCGGSSIDDAAFAQAVGSLGQAIQGGYVDETDTAAVGIVAMIGWNAGACTGSLIAPTVVLTAQHCVAPVVGGDQGVQCGKTTFGSPYDAADIFITTRTSLSQNLSDYHKAQQVVIPPGGNDFCGRDVAIIILRDPIDPAEAVPLVPAVDAPLAKGSEYYAIGYGATSDSQSAPSGTRRRRDKLFTTCVADKCPSQQIKPEEWLGDTGVCSGDSGGPAIDLANRVVGVVSRGGAGCTTPIYGYVLAWGQWIKDTTLWACQNAALEPPQWATGWPTDPAYSYPVGGPCGKPEDCPSNACLAGYCTRLCNELAPCPDGYECKPHGFCEALPPPPPATKKKKSSSDDEEEVACSVRPAAPGAAGAAPIAWLALCALGVALASARRHRGRAAACPQP